MPRIEIRDPRGVYSCITSSDPELCAKWLWEMVSTMSEGLQSDPPLSIRLSPAWVHRNGTDVPDWSPDSRLLGDWFVRMDGLDTPYKRAQKMIEMLQQIAETFHD